MALSNIADVTRSIISVIEWALRQSGDWPVGGEPAVLPLPPDRMTEAGLSVFLYHVQENTYNKNMHLPSSPMPGQQPAQSAPMGLNLFFQVCARSAGENPSADDLFQEQLMMSIALQVLHDYAEINDSTELEQPPAAPINVLNQFGLRGRTNRFKISLQPMLHNESVHFWTAGQSSLRLAAYYEVSVVFLEPKRVARPVGRVLTYGTFVFTEGAPQLTATRNTLAFTIPGEASPRQIDLQPAQVPPGALFELLGVNLGGDIIDVQLVNTLLPGGSAVVDAAWTLTRTGADRLTVTVQPTIVTPGGPVAVLPGLYAAQVLITRRRALPTGQLRDFKYVSNQFPVTISPRIDAVSAPAAGRITVTGYLFQDASLPPDSVQVYVGDHRLDRRTAAGNPAAGQFRITAANTLVVSLAGLDSGKVLPLRVLVAGAEAAPRWVTIP